MGGRQHPDGTGLTTPGAASKAWAEQTCPSGCLCPLGAILQLQSRARKVKRKNMGSQLARAAPGREARSPDKPHCSCNPRSPNWTLCDLTGRCHTSTSMTLTLIWGWMRVEPRNRHFQRVTSLAWPRGGAPGLPLREPPHYPSLLCHLTCGVILF